MNISTDVLSPAPHSARLIDVRVTNVRALTADTKLIEFQPVAGAALPAAQPGAHIDVHLPDGMIRQYSLVNPNAAPSSYAIGVKLDPNSRGGSRYLFERLASGQSLSIGAPRNHFPLTPNARHSVLFAGGIGITPIWAMLQQLKASASSWELHYAARSRADMAFREELEALEAAHLHFDDENDGKVLDLGAIASQAPPETHFYCCGPVPMLDAFRAATAAMPSEQVHFEYFAAKEERNLDGSFVVELARSGKEFFIPPGKSILEVLHEAGFDADSSCQEGICGICETAVISGIPDHRDAVLSDHERATNKIMMICCSGSKTDRLVLDK